MKSNANNIFDFIDAMISREKMAGVKFDENGLPIFEKWMFYDAVPKEIFPYRHRKEAKSPQETAICFYEPDEALYRRLRKMKETAKELNKYACFVGFDLSIFSGFLKPLQDFYILANLVIDIYLILMGNKMIPNLRADESGGYYFGLFKEAKVVCCGTLGCSLHKDVKNKNKKFIERYTSTNTNQILIQYGSKLVNKQNTISFQSFGWRNR